MESRNDLNAPKKDYCAPMHTTEHILNRTMDNMFSCGRSFSAHIESKKSKCDYHFTKENVPDEKSLQQVETKVNEVLHRNLNVTAKIVSRDEAADIADLTRLPKEAGETLRLVYVGDYDVCPCIGNHVENTSECGTFQIISHSYEDGVLRIRWKLIK